MKKIVVSAALLLSGLCSAQPGFMTDFMNDHMDRPTMIKCADGGFIAGGDIDLYSSFTLAIFKLDSLGQTQWSVELGILPLYQVSAYRLLALPDSGFVFVGNASLAFQTSNYLLVRFDKNGAQVGNEMSYAYEKYSAPQGVFLRSDGNILVTGTAYDNGGSGAGFAIFLFNLNLQLIQQDYLRFPNAWPQSTLSSTAYAMDDQDNLFVTGSLIDQTSAGSKAYPFYACIDPSFQMTYNHVYSSPEMWFYPQAIVPCAHGVYMVGRSDSTFVSSYQYTLGVMRCDDTGQPVFYKRYRSIGAYQSIYHSHTVIADSNENIYLNHGLSSTSTFYDTAAIAEFYLIDSLGNVIASNRRHATEPTGLVLSGNQPVFFFQTSLNGWSEHAVVAKADVNTDLACFGEGPAFSSSVDMMNNIVDSSFLMPNMVDSIMTSNNAFSVTIIPHTYQLLPFCQSANIQEQKMQTFTLSPNPAANFIYIQSNTALSCEIGIFDVSGKRVISQSFYSACSVDIATLANGIYMIQFRLADGTCQSERLVVHH